MKKFIGVLALIGFIVLLGAVGKCDYMVETYQYYPFKYTVYQALIGLGLILLSVYLYVKEEY